MNDAILRHYGSQPGVGYDFACAAGRAGLVLIGPAGKTHDTILAQQASPAPNLTLHMPCGNSVTYNSAVDLPDMTTPCDCGEPDCWYVYRVYT